MRLRNWPRRISIPARGVMGPATAQLRRATRNAYGRRLFSGNFDYLVFPRLPDADRIGAGGFVLALECSLGNWIIFTTGPGRENPGPPKTGHGPCIAFCIY